MRWFAGMSKREMSKFGKWLKKKQISQADVARKSGVGGSTVGRLANEPGTKPTLRNARKLVKAMKELSQEQVAISDFWDVDED